MGNTLSSDITCDASSNGTLASGLYTIGSRTFGADCGYDTTGPVLRVVATDFYDCINGCASDSQCKAISWVNGMCYEKSSVGDIIPSDHGVASFTDFFASDLSCPASDGASWYDFNVQCGVDYPGTGDIGMTTEAALVDCIDSCRGTPECVAVVYSGNACYHKDNTIGEPVRNAAVSGAIQQGFTPAPPTPDPAAGNTCPSADGTIYDGYLIACDTDYFGGDLTSTTTATFEDCIAACTANGACVDVSYVSGSCYLKSVLTAKSTTVGVWNAKSLNPVVNPVTTLACPAADGTSQTVNGADFTVACYTDYPGGDYRNLYTEDFSGCLSECASDVQCTDVAWNHGSCYLKSTLVAAVTNENVWGAIKAIATVPVANITVPVNSNSTNATSFVPADRRVRRRPVRLAY
jgi:hypothetical protein